MTFEELCRLSEQCLPDAPYRELLTTLHNDMLAALAQPKEKPLHPVHIGVDVTREGTAITAFYCKPDAVMEMFYSQFHPLAQPEQEPVAWANPNDLKSFDMKVRTNGGPLHTVPLYTSPPQRTTLTDEEIEQRIGYRLPASGFDAIRQLIKEKNT